MTAPGRWRLWWGVATVLAVVAVAVTVLAVVDRGGGTTPAAPPSAPVTSTTPSDPTLPTLAVKIDNVAAARPQTGLGAAEVVYVEPVEGGLTRLVAIYAGTPPPVVGPVRSARRTDIELLGQYGTPCLAYSGAAPELLPALHGAPVVDAAPPYAASAYYRDRDRRAPHNLYVRSARLPGGSRGPAIAPLRFGPAPHAGVRTVTERVRYPAAEFRFTWSTVHRRWQVSMDGTPLTSTDTGRVAAATVVWQRVAVTMNGAFARTVGHGTAVVLRDGQRFDGTWTRPVPRSPTVFRTADGQELPLAAGPVWILLVPA